jgi:anti-sigma regulatory factor (Ser/Thr protein kinase)
MRLVDGFVAGFASERGISAQEVDRILILLEELITNLVKYGYADRSEPGRAEIALELTGGRLEIEFIDDGCEFNPFTRPAVRFDEPVESRPVGGLGLHILKSMCDETSYERLEERNVIRLARKMSPRESS